MKSNVNLNGQDLLHWYKSTEIEYTDMGFPRIRPLGDIPTEVSELQFSKAKTSTKYNSWVHFYLHNFLFERIWNFPDKYIPILSKYQGIFMPDFSVFWDMPEPLQMFNYYRSLWFAAYAQIKGIKVIPSAVWSDEKSYSWCFEGIPKNDVLCISAVGCLREKENAKLFYSGCERCISEVAPKVILLRSHDGKKQELQDFIQQRTTAKIQFVEIEKHY